MIGPAPLPMRLARRPDAPMKEKRMRVRPIRTPARRKGEENQSLITDEIEYLLAAEKNVSYVERQGFCEAVTEGYGDGQGKSEAAGST